VLTSLVGTFPNLAVIVDHMDAVKVWLFCIEISAWITFDVPLMVDNAAVSLLNAALITEDGRHVTGQELTSYPT